MDISVLNEYGINYKEGLARCMGNKALYELLLSMVLEDESFENAVRAHENADREALFRALHELKGACGNAAISGLFNAVNPLVELVRDGGEGVEQRQIDELFAVVTKEYERAIRGITLALGR